MPNRVVRGVRRRAQPALIHGEMQMLDAHPQALAFVRTHADQRILCVFNLSESAIAWEVPADSAGAQPLTGSPLGGASLHGSTLALQAWGAVLLAIANTTP